MIFISYRRQDSQAEARNIWMVLKEAYRDRDMVFFDRDAIRAGDRWAREIAEKLASSSLVVAVIGNEWLTCQDEYGRRRIDDPEDWVRKEIQYALEHNITIVPALVNEARMPPRDSLPDVLRGLCDWQAVRLTEENWERDVLSILDRIRVDYLPVPSILLTSKSPRRKELLRQIGWYEGIDYYAVHASVHLEEDTTENSRLEDCIRYAEETAREKINYVATDWTRLRSILGTDINLADTLVVGVDTIAVCDNQILDTPLRRAIEFAGPQDFEDARSRAFDMLRKMRGKQIKMITSIAAALANDLQHPVTKTTITDAKLREYSEEDITSYINSAEPYDKAGAFGIQEKGVALFEGISGSYSNIVGLPVREFISVLQEHFGDRFMLPTFQSVISENGVAYSDPEFSALCMGDINYDFIYDRLPEDFFADLKAPGKKVLDDIRRGAGGTAINFAKGAREAGFTSCVVVGVVGRDALGLEIENELARLGITPLLPRDPAEETSIAIILRNQAKKDISITLTDANQSLPDFVVERAKSEIEKTDVFYCSGYSLIDPNRKENAIKMLELARDAQCIVILDIVVHMDSKITYEEISRTVRPKRNTRPKGVIVSEFPEIFRWFNIPFEQGAEVDAWTQHRESISERLREDFAVAILRTSNYTHEAIITGHTISELFELDYTKIARTPRRKVGYADYRTAQQVFSFLSPRIVMASKSPQRLDLLCQLVSPRKIQVRISEVPEDHIPHESPYDRVKRLALAKAEDVLSRGDFSDSIEFIIGADTEIILQDPVTKEWQMVGHPTTIAEAEEDLRYLSGKTHIAVTGMAIIGVDPTNGQRKTIVDAVETRVTLANLSDREIEEYAASGEPLGRAGAYAIQGLGIRIIERIEGSYSNVVGLPLEHLAEILSTEFNRPVWTFDKVSDWNFPIPIKQAVQAPIAK